MLSATAFSPVKADINGNITVSSSTPTLLQVASHDILLALTETA